MIDFNKLTDEQAELIKEGFYLFKYEFKTIIEKHQEMSVFSNKYGCKAFEKAFKENKENLIKLYEMVYQDKYKI